MNIPVNRWTVGIAVALISVFGGDFVSAVMRVVMAIGYNNVPAV